MKRFGLLAVLILAICLSLGNAAVAADKPVTFTLGHFEPPDVQNTIEHPMAVVFKSIVEARTNGQVKVEIHPSNTLGNEREMLESTQMGVMQGCIIAEGTVPVFYPMVQVFSVPYIFATESVGWAVTDGAFGDALFEDMRKKTGLRVIATGRGAFRNFTNSKRPITSPKDMDGLKIRTMQVPAHMTMVKSLGGAATPIAWAELYSALQTGVVDGQENPVGVIVSGRLAEVQKYLTLDGHVYSTSFFIISDQWLAGLPKAYQQVILDAGRAATVTGRGISRLQDAIGMETLQKAGMNVTSLSPEALAEFRKLSQQPVIEWMKANIKGSEPWIDKLLQETAKTEKSFGF
jgi:tripartite ATP-independent transporter DctP family solute receptor